MGIAKRFMEEQQSKGYSSKEDITVCKNCFDEYGIERFIEDHQTHNTCSYCRESGAEVVACELDALIEHILESISYEWGHPANECLPYESREGGWQFADVYNTWELLDEIDIGNKDGQIYEDICSSIYNQEWCQKNPFSLKQNETLMDGWHKFSDFVCNTARYVFFKAENSSYDENQHDEMNPVDILDALGSIFNKIGMVKKLSNSTLIKRVRIVNPEVELSSAKELGSPPNEFARMANRMSPAGISMFYGAFDVETAIKETYEPDQRRKKAICGTFKLTRDLIVIDLSKKSSIPSLFDEHERHLRDEMSFLSDFISDFTKPIERTDRAHVDYVPTQIVTEYIRHIFKTADGRNIDGVIYPSSKNKRKCAIVIFADSESCVELTHEGYSGAILALVDVEEHELVAFSE
ncbi:RES domain-containing protein [Methylomonas sp. LL1]|uniref:HEPN-associated N-terminal domain-containing protein n=1 Tax=Methylomonas sp. LL1 TaxID=2785785 RepID=UPI0018C3DB48|nr:HEPN-associated N-terminal domain-containing protein [Methylomonas sp. LL1]QPK62555.1 RES domain-containing protein [Methylomonas sp. LL1]